MSRVSPSRLVLTGALLALSACHATGENRVRLDTVDLCAKTVSETFPIVAEKAVTSSQRRNGLMGRESIGENEGMLFVYQETRPPEANFWMYRTLIPLDIAYTGRDGEIRAIREMQPCASEDATQCPRYPAGVEYQLALEMPQGFFRQRGIGVGDRIMRLDTEGACNLPPV
ncbi:hypothetical protein RE428_24940 [Marinobacter nanhaiticus D15-8W]|nr:hypothetical protein RE428_24940 [Marinobacter nanhaiticus D15-8W]